MLIFKKINEIQDEIKYIIDENIKLKSRISELEKEIEKLKEESIFNFPAGTRVLINELPNLLTKKKKKK